MQKHHRDQREITSDMERSHTLSVVSWQITNVQATTLHKIPTGTVNCLLFPTNERLNHDRTLYVHVYHGPQRLLVNEIYTHTPSILHAT